MGKRGELFKKMMMDAHEPTTTYRRKSIINISYMRVVKPEVITGGRHETKKEKKDTARRETTTTKAILFFLPSSSM